MDFLLAVGGGSVIDGTKLISAGIQYDGDPWELVQKGYYYHTVPMGTVLTLPATGSEMNSGAVISRKETQEKFPFYSNFPVFSILDPETTFSLPPVSSVLRYRRYLRPRDGAIYDYDRPIPLDGSLGGKYFKYLG